MIVTDPLQKAAFDVTQTNLTSTPPHYLENFFNQPWVQQELGVPLNFTSASNPITNSFVAGTGDVVVGSLHTLEKVMDKGVNVAMIYGDRDYRCNCKSSTSLICTITDISGYGGENVSLTLDFPSSPAFRAAGYAPITTNSSYQGGFVRQHGSSLSFSRIFQAGHGVAAYQPETLSKIFERAMFGRDIATGDVDLDRNANYTTKGPHSVRDVKNEIPEEQESICHVRLAPITCTDEQMMALADGSAVVEDWVVVEPKGPGAKNGSEDAQVPQSAGSRYAALGQVLVPLVAMLTLI